MYKSQIEFENEISRGFPLVSGIAHNLSYDIPHYHSEMEIVYVAEGTLTAICDGEAWSIGSNEFFIFMPGEPHGFDESFENFALCRARRNGFFISASEIMRRKNR